MYYVCRARTLMDDFAIEEHKDIKTAVLASLCRNHNSAIVWFDVTTKEWRYMDVKWEIYDVR